MYNSLGFGAGSMLGFFGPFVILIIAWTLYWKGRALWLAARKGSLYWFIALLLINTVGILEILYIYIFSKNEFCCGGDNKSCSDSKSEGCGGKDEKCCKKEEVTEKKV
ncbi:MAG: hypothetical protein ACD_72C00052G0001 [uncultured bacterium]|nr:MAG: hypothetical protein ACD_72C00052G0001 [uncultured bacterium]